ncbi:BlaI/MecI/CopY family transcriptional regulator [bacterium]|nr:BlaI/MecI/CopY family transcriptional regulator [bacterium]
MKKLPKISEAEWQVMKVVWAKKNPTTNDVVDALTPTTAWKPKTIMTMLKRLVDKGALGFEQKGRIYEYFPKVGEAECEKAESRSFIQRVYGGSLKPMLSHFIEDKSLSKAEIEELKKILEQKR